MLQPSQKTQSDHPSPPYSQITNHKLLTNFKKSHLRNLLPPIQMPSAKRSTGDYHGTGRGRRKSFTLAEDDDQQERIVIDGLVNILCLNGGDGEKLPKFQKFDVFKILENQKDLPCQRIKKCIRIAKILSYLYNQLQPQPQPQPQSPNPPHPHPHPPKIYTQWQLHQIHQNYQDTNLGDFIIKIANPDMLPEQAENFKKFDEDNKEINSIDIFKAMEKYDQLFNTETVYDKNLEDCQKEAFQLGFFMIGVENVGENTRRMDEVCAPFLHSFSYFTKISQQTYSQYLQHKRNLQFKHIQQTLQKPLQQLLKSSQSQLRSSKVQKWYVQNIFHKYKVDIYTYLRKRLLGYDGYGNRKVELDYREYFGIFGEELEGFWQGVVRRVWSVSELFRYFPELTDRLLKHIKAQISRAAQLDPNQQPDQSTTISCKLYNGGYLSRISHQGQLKWILAKQRPSDVLTLVRKFIVYRLTYRGGLFIRSFLSKDQKYIFLVIKASEEHLEKMAQMSNFNMEIQLGSVDIFSFEPVDKYGRPLRCNKYLRESSFIKKYNLSSNKQDKDQNLGQKSVQSQALNLYKKSLKMNKEQLRAKMILDQQQCDSLFSWLSNKVKTNFIQPDQILNNDYNEQQIQQDIWPIYYVYNKSIIEYLKKLKQQFQMERNKKTLEALNSNIGLMLRLMFLKALNFCNDLYVDHRDVHFKVIRNWFIRRHPLQTIWNQMGEDMPRGYFPYSKRLNHIWRKYQINQQKDRSKFTPSARLIITNKIIRQYLNISKSLMSKLIVDFYPIHDPFILKHIKVRPYLNVLSSLINEESMGRIRVREVQEEDSKIKMGETFVEYQCEYTKEDFTKFSVEEKLKFRWTGTTDFSVNSVAFYCGEKLAFFFEFRRYLTQKAWPLCIFSIIVQILFWVENTHLEQSGTSDLTSLNNALMVIMVIINTFWAENTVNQWRDRQKKMARSFGTHDMDQKSQTQKRVLFQGQMKRNLQTNQINDEHENRLISTIKQLISLLINLVFITLMAATILIIFTMKGQLYQLGFPQSTITVLPSILISVSTQVYNFVYSKIIGILVDFQNKKTIHQYENSLTSKSFVVTFVVTYFALFIYGFFQQYFDGETVCSIKTTSGAEITNCYYYLSSQIVTSVIIDFLLTIVMAFQPLALFLYTQHKQKHAQQQPITSNLNYFQSIDSFYQQQDKMQTFMYTDEIDKTWQGYTAIVISFTTLALFAPIVPFLYVMMFLTGVVWLNAKKYQIIYFSRRTLPIKVKSIGIWLNVIRGVSVIGVFVNVGLIVFVRGVVTNDKAIVFFSCVFLILVIKYLMSFTGKDEDVVGKRVKIKTKQIVTEKAFMNFSVRNNLVNTDIENVIYDERELRRKLPTLKQANVRYK